MTEITDGLEETGSINLLLCSFSVFLMQAGFTVLEAGRVRAKNVQSIMFKNILDLILSSFVYLFIGWGFAYGSRLGDDASFSQRLIAYDDFAISETKNFICFFFQWTFCATTTTIVTGALAERCEIKGYIFFVIIMSGFIYPVLSHWLWNDGWLSYGQRFGVIDYAGSGGVHMTGGIAGLFGAWRLGPRIGRFESQGVINISGHSAPLQMLGTYILWFGFYGFNAGSTYAYITDEVVRTHVISRIAVNTTLSASSSGLMSCLISILKFHDNIAIYNVCNACVCGLAAICAGCATVNIFGAVMIGGISGALYHIGQYIVLRLRIDDPLDVISVHGLSGFWGLLSVGIFSKKTLIKMAYPKADIEWLDRQIHEVFLTQLFGVFVIAVWVGTLSFVTYFLIDKFIGLRVSREIEIAGLDAHRHGSEGWLVVARRVSTVADYRLEEPIVMRMPSKNRSSSVELPEINTVDNSISKEVTIDDMLRDDVQFCHMETDGHVDYAE